MTDYLLAHEPLAARDRVTAQRSALRQGSDLLTFAQLDTLAAGFAARLLEAGVRAGERVLLLMRNSPDVFVALLGAARVGAVVVPVNWRLSPSELGALVSDCRPSAVIHDDGFESHLAAATEIGAPRLVVPVESLREWCRAAPETPIEYRAAATDVVILVYTSGTSGVPKAVMLTNENLGAKVPRMVRHWSLAPSSVNLLATPLCHIGALSSGLTALNAGAMTILGETDAEVLLSHFRHDGVTHAFVVPAMLDRMCAAASARDRFPMLSTLLFGAAPITDEVRRRSEALFGPVLRHVYGLSETTGGITELCLDAKTPDDLASSVGRPYPWVEVGIRDLNTGAPVPTGVRGEIWTRSAQNTVGYFQRESETAELLPGQGWLRTGDVGWLTEDDHLFVTDRIKDMIITGGENVYSAEVENVLRSMPGIADAAVIGLPDEKWGERVVAVCVPSEFPGPETPAVIGFARDRLAHYKAPREVQLLDTLPRNASGKVLKSELRVQFGASPQSEEVVT